MHSSYATIFGYKKSMTSFLLKKFFLYNILKIFLNVHPGWNYFQCFFNVHPGWNYFVNVI